MSPKQFADEYALDLEQAKFERAGLKPKPCGLTSESVSTDFHELRQSFSSNRADERKLS